MKLVDIIIILILLLIVGLVVYFSFIKNKGDKCKGCHYAKNCNKNNCNKGS